MTIKELIDLHTVEKTSWSLLRYIGEDNIEDFIQDIYVEVLSLNEARLQLLGNDLPRYVAQICINQACGSNSAFKKKYVDNKTCSLDEAMSATEQ